MKSGQSLKRLCKVVIFLLLLGFMTDRLQGVLRIEFAVAHEILGSFYDEPEDSLDAVYIGSSNTYAFWQPTLAWDEFGINVHTLSAPSMRGVAVRYMIEEARKTQPDALYIVTLNSFMYASKMKTAAIHRLVNPMPLSLNKIRLINAISRYNSREKYKDVEYYIPLIRFHTRWDSLTTADFYHPPELLKGGQHYDAFLNKSVDLTFYNKTEEKNDLSEEQISWLDDLFLYCRENDVRVLFLAAPMHLKPEVACQLNALCEYVTENGFDVLDCFHAPEETGLDLRVDFYNEKHVNIHGSMKFVSYLGNYLVQQYGFEDKRGREACRSWDEAAKRYTDLIAPYTLDFERERLPRNDALSIPKITSLQEADGGLRLEWSASEGAAAYAVYRKDGEEEPYRRVATVTGETVFADPGLSPGTQYDYIVVPLSYDGETECFGSFRIPGTGAVFGDG